jgi:2'-5' RNA ligase
MRTFLAIELPDSVKTKLDKQLVQLKKEHAQLSWVPSKNYHITVHFFGEIENIDKLKKRIEDALYDAEEFQLFSLGMGIFIDNKITLFVDFERQKKLEDLVSKIHDRVLHTREKVKFIPHITVARYKVPSKQQYLHLKKKLEEMDIDIEFPVQKIYLYQSVLQPQASQYTKIAEFPLHEEI